MNAYALNNCALNRGLPKLHTFGGSSLFHDVEYDHTYPDCGLVQVYGESAEIRVDDDGKAFFVPYSRITPDQIKEEARKKPNIIRVM